MLVLTRKPGETIYVGDDVRVTLVRLQGGAARIGIEAPADRPVLRGELLERKKNERRNDNGENLT